MLLDEPFRNVTSQMRNKYITMDECVISYGFTTMKRFSKHHPSAFNAFVDVMEGPSVAKIVKEMVELMMRKKKCIFF
jgi:hypothetical protein